MQPGERIGKYVVEGPLGAGGNGAVFAAQDAVLGRRVALKVLHHELLLDPTIAARFRQEAQAMAQMSHPNVVVVHDFVAEAGRWVLVMELIEGGQTLASLLRREGRVPPARALRIVAQVAGALGHAHRRGIVHRDVKPANVMLVQAGPGAGGEVAKLTDFGIARVLHGERRTQAQLTLGTLWYLAPEQAQDSSVDARADVYALGCTLYEALVGHVPFPYDNIARVLAAHVGEPPRSPSGLVAGVPPALEELLMRCLAKLPHERPEDGEAMRARCEEVLAQLEPRPASLRPPSAEGPAAASAFAPLRTGLAFEDAARPPFFASPPPASPSQAASPASIAARQSDRRLGLYIGAGALLFVVAVCGLGVLLSLLTCARVS
jgi:serine/threonine-protein kinase